MDERESVLRRYVRAVGNLLWPPACPRCAARVAAPEVRFCESCWGRLEALPPPAVRRDPDFRSDEVDAAFLVNEVFLDVLAAAKYRRMPRVLEELARRAASERSGRVGGDWLVPVPLAPAKRRERGFNQAEVVARFLAAAGGPPVVEGALERVRGGRALAGQAKEVRARAIAGAYRVRREAWSTWPPAGEIVLVDDVITTGATLGDCARALREAGYAGRLRGICVGRSLQTSDRPVTAVRDALGRL